MTCDRCLDRRHIRCERGTCGCDVCGGAARFLSTKDGTVRTRRRYHQERTRRRPQVTRSVDDMPLGRRAPGAIWGLTPAQVAEVEHHLDAGTPQHLLIGDTGVTPAQIRTIRYRRLGVTHSQVKAMTQAQRAALGLATQRDRKAK